MDKTKDRPLVAIDCIIFGFDQDAEALKLLLIKSPMDSGENSWSLVSGFLNTNETIDDAAHRILHSLTGLTNVYLEQLQVFSSVYFDPSPRTIAVAYYALINTDLLSESQANKYSANWVNLPKKPKLIFDHNKMVDRAIKRLQRRAKTQPIGFQLLPEKFTMRQLQKLYEEILDEEFDKRNFTRKINSLGILEKLAEKDKTSSRKGSYLFKFNKEKYQRQRERGFVFAVK
jgi:ADP-ribose pyrophosphatase YjhB (NUDIX family)